MSEVLSWVFAVLFLLVIIAWYLTYTAARLDRLHVRLTGTLAALDAQLVRRAEASLELANSGLLDGATSLILATAAAESLENPGEHGEIRALFQGTLALLHPVQSLDELRAIEAQRDPRLVAVRREQHE